MSKLPPNTCPTIDSVLDDVDKAIGLLNIKREMEQIRDANSALRERAEQADDLQEKLDDAESRITDLEHENANLVAEIQSLERALNESGVTA